MKHWEKSKKDLRRSDEREVNQLADANKKKKLRPVEKVKYRLRGPADEEE